MHVPPLHNGTLRASRFFHWLRHFHGVATRYLENCLDWQRAIDLGRIANSEPFLRTALGVLTSASGR